MIKNKNLYDKFWSDGYINLGKLFSEEEVTIIKSAINSNKQMKEQHDIVKQKFDKGEYPSFESIFVMNDVFTDNIFSLACRKTEILDFISYLFDDDAYLYHTKVPLKYPGMLGFKYHQDYYYWYQMGCLFPNMATCFIALDKATVKNGCISYIPKSHLCGRIEHIEYEGFSDSEADPKRVTILKEKFGESKMILEPGEVAIHHANTLHGSSNNTSPDARIALLGCFNTKSNSPVGKNWDHPYYQKQPRFNGKIEKKHLTNLPDFSISFKE